MLCRQELHHSNTMHMQTDTEEPYAAVYCCITDAGIFPKSVSYLHYPADYHFMIITLALNVGSIWENLEEIQLQTLLMGEWLNHIENKEELGLCLGTTGLNCLKKSKSAG